MSERVVWSFVQPYGEGYILQQAYHVISRESDGNTYASRHHPVVIQQNGEYTFKYRIVHMSEVIENSGELVDDFNQRVDE